jgi:type IV pilus assembly protein PilE
MQQGFTLVEVMIVVVIVAILVSVAIPSYQDHIISGKLSEATATLANGRIRMEQHFQDSRTYANFTCMPATSYFTYDCNTPAATTTTYTLTATGIDSVAAFSYTIDQNNTKMTTAMAPGWGTAPVNCWITKRAKTC